MFSGLVVINYSPVFDSDIWKNTAERLALYSFSGGVFSFYNIVFFYKCEKIRDTEHTHILSGILCCNSIKESSSTTRVLCDRTASISCA